MEMGDIYETQTGKSHHDGAKKTKSVCTPTVQNPMTQGPRRRFSQSLARRFSARQTDMSKANRESSFRESVTFNTGLTFQDPRQSAFQQRQTLVDAVIDEIEVIEDGIYKTFSGDHSFHIAWGCYMFLLSLLGGVVLYLIDDISFINAWFNATSACVNSGLSAISPEDHSKSSYVVLGMLMLLGSGPFLLLPSLVQRCRVLSRYSQDMENALRSIMITEESKHVIRQHQLLYDASLVTIYGVVLYLVLCVSIGTILLVIFLPLQPMEPTLQERNISYFQNALFSSISAFTNSGMVMSPDSLVYIGDNPPVLVVYTALILTGNVLMPVLLRYLFLAMQRILQYYADTKSSRATSDALFSTITTVDGTLSADYGTSVEDAVARVLRSLHFILNNPRLITTQLFLPMENNYLLQFFFLSNVLLFVIFLAVCFTNDAFTSAYTSSPHTAFLGLFQNINMRHSGFGVLSFRDMPQSMLLVYAVAMFLSPVPYIGVLHASGTWGGGTMDVSISVSPYALLLCVWYNYWMLAVYEPNLRKRLRTIAISVQTYVLSWHWP